MKGMKHVIALLLGSLLFGCALSGCGADGKDGKDGQDGVGITSIEKTASEGGVDTYTVYFSDGTSTTFEVTNGKDGQDGQDGQAGEDGQDVTVSALYEAYCEKYGQIAYGEFLEQYLSLEKDDAHVIARCLQSVVKVFSEFTERDDDLQSGMNQAVYTGAGIVYQTSADSVYFLTNYHVVHNEDAMGTDKISDTIHCYLYGSERAPHKETEEGQNTYTYDEYAIPCEYVGGSITYDVAVLRADRSAVEGVNPNVQAVTLAQGYSVGQTAFTVGNPNGEGLSATKGIVSVESEQISLSIDGTERAYRAMRIDTPLYKGNSGGGLFNVEGELIGLVNAGILSQQNVNYAIPVSIVEGVAENVLRYAKDGDAETQGVLKVKLGVTVRGQNSKYVYDGVAQTGKIVEECLVTEVADGSIVHSLGIQADDVIASFFHNGEEIALERTFTLGDFLFGVEEGDEIAFSYRRGGQLFQTQTHTVAFSDLVYFE